MSSTHSALYYHIVFGTKNQAPVIDGVWRERFHSYLGGLVRTAGGVATSIGGINDHVHLLASLRPTHQLSEVLRDIKRQSSAWIHDEIKLPNFHWQDGYGAFTVCASQLESVVRYIAGQEEHHRRLFADGVHELIAGLNLNQPAPG